MTPVGSDSGSNSCKMSKERVKESESLFPRNGNCLSANRLPPNDDAGKANFLDADPAFAQVICGLDALQEVNYVV